MNNLILSSFSDAVSFFLYIILAILILLVMITVHEFGHYITGKIFGFGIEEFSVGFGPKLFSKKKKNGEVVSIRMIPLGGYCAFMGEDRDDVNPLAFNNKKPWQRLIVLLSGAFMNYLLSIIVISCMFGFYGKSSVMAYKTVEDPNYSVQNSFQNRDVLLKVNGKTTFMITDVMNAISGLKEGEMVSCDIYRNGQVYNDFQLILRSDADFKNIEDFASLAKCLGIEYQENDKGEIVESGFRTTAIKLGFFDTISSSFSYSFKLAGTIFIIIKQLFTGSIGVSALGGTVTTISVTANAIKTGGLWTLLNITSLIGVNLAVFNVLPFPALDGSKAIFTVIEWIRGKPINRKVENIIHSIGFVILITFSIFVDVQKLF